MANYQKELKAVKAALAEAALLCRRVQRTLAPTALTKQDRSPVTLADFGSQALVCRTLREAFPGDPIMAEEDAGALRNGRHAELLSELVAQVQRVRPDARPEDVLDWIDYGQATGYHERFWTLDPVDGTKGFLRGQHYAIALALIERGQVVLSGLSCPNMDKGAGAQFVAARGQGGQQVAADTVRVSSTSATASARLCESVEAAHSAHGDAARVVRALGITRPGVRLDSQAKYAAVARGDADIYLRLPRDRTYIERIWDHAAGSLLVTEAGGRVTDCRGRELDFGCGGRLERNLGIVATNGVLHDAVIASLKQLGIGQG
ncbi:MAG: 3'(2'),5'-bisphosphate nucleotidase [Bacteroidota bacterium]|nr:3'(2'),5'-bisphosphate nucleotidase [Bacteroidota bacterium]